MKTKPPLLKLWGGFLCKPFIVSIKHSEKMQDLTSKNLNIAKGKTTHQPLMLRKAMRQKKLQDFSNSFYKFFCIVPNYQKCSFQSTFDFKIIIHFYILSFPKKSYFLTKFK